MRMNTLGLIMVIIGLIGGVVAYSSGLIYNAVEYYKMGIGANIVQVIGLAGIFIDR